MNENLQYSSNGMALTEKFEGLRLSAYQDSKGTWTIGYGHTGKSVWAGLTITEDTAKHLLASDILVACHAVRSYVTIPLTQNQFDALVDFVFNEGSEHLHTSTLLRRVNEDNHTAAAEEFMRWVYAGGEVEPGLQTRRAAERDLYLTA